MSDLKIIPFNKEHLNVMDLRSYELNGIMKNENVEQHILNLQNIHEANVIYGDTVTFIEKGRIITCVGFAEIWKGVCEIWQIPSIYMDTVSVKVSRTIYRYLEEMAGSFKYHRMQTVAPDDDLHARWMKFLKFEKEGTMRKYTNDKKDYIQYGRLF